MQEHKQRSTNKKQRTGILIGKRKQEGLLEEHHGQVDLGPSSGLSKPVETQSPAKKNISEEKINDNCPLLLKENETIVTRRKALELGLNSGDKTIVQSHHYILRCLYDNVCQTNQIARLCTT